MKYFPLVWAAIRRKPVRAILVLLSVTVAFLLFGMTIGLNATARGLVENARQDRVLVNRRFAGAQLTLALVEQIKNIPHVKTITPLEFIGGYVRDPKSSASVIMIDPDNSGAWPELGLTPAQLAQLKRTRTGVFITRKMAETLKLKSGDPLPVTGGEPRADGAKAWVFNIMGIVDDMPNNAGPQQGYGLGNFQYLDEARIATLRGNVGAIRLLADSVDNAQIVATAIDKKFTNAPVPTRSLTERDAYEAGVSGSVDIIGVTQSVAAAGLFMILFLTANSIAQSVRERIPEFAAMKTIGFSDTGVMSLVFAEAVIPCLFGAVLGIGLAAGFTAEMPKLLPPNLGLPLPTFTSTVLILAFAIATAVAFASAVIPALRIKRLSVAAALSGR